MQLKLTVHYIWVLTLILSNMRSGYKFPQHFRGVQKRCQLPVEKNFVFFRTERVHPFAWTLYGLLCLLAFRGSHLLHEAKHSKLWKETKLEIFVGFVTIFSESLPLQVWFSCCISAPLLSVCTLKLISFQYVSPQAHIKKHTLPFASKRQRFQSNYQQAALLCLEK